LCHKIWKLCERIGFSRNGWLVSYPMFPTIDWKVIFNGFNQKTKTFKNCNQLTLSPFVAERLPVYMCQKRHVFRTPGLWAGMFTCALTLLAIYYIPYISPPEGQYSWIELLYLISEIRKTRTHKGWTKCVTDPAFLVHQNSRGLHFMDEKV